MSAVMGTVILRLEHLCKNYGALAVTQDVNLALLENELHAVIGPNGAGKTTLIHQISGLAPSDSGRILLESKEITHLTMPERVHRGLVRSFQISAVFPRMSVRENVRMALQRPTGSSYRFWQSERTLGVLNDRIDELLDAVGMLSYRNHVAVNLPYGRKRALEIATTLALDPEMLLLDEPTSGMGHEDVDRIAELIRKVSAERTILMVEHNLSVVAALSDTITVLAQGRVLAEGNYETVSRDPRVIEAYIGGADD